MLGWVVLCCVVLACFRYRPMKHTCSSVQQDLTNKLQRFDFALNDAGNNGCR